MQPCRTAPRVAPGWLSEKASMCNHPALHLVAREGRAHTFRNTKPAYTLGCSGGKGTHLSKHKACIHTRNLFKLRAVRVVLVILWVKEAKGFVRLASTRGGMARFEYVSKFLLPIQPIRRKHSKICRHLGEGIEEHKEFFAAVGELVRAFVCIGDGRGNGECVPCPERFERIERSRPSSSVLRHESQCQPVRT